MSVLALEGWVEEGNIRLVEPKRLPNRQRVFVIVPDADPSPAHMRSPRLADPAQAVDFVLEVSAGSMNKWTPSA